MGLPCREHIEIPRYRQHIFRHSGAEALDVPFLRTVEAQLPIEAAAVHLGRHLEKNHPGEAAPMGVHGVVVPGSLAIQPEVDGLQPVAAWHPRPTALRRLAIHHMADPALAGRQQLSLHQLLHAGLIRAQLPLFAELSRQLGGGIRTGLGMGKHLTCQVQQLIQQLGRQLSLQDRPRKQIEYLHHQLMR